MSEYRSLPLGIDIGATRARIAFAEARKDGGGRVRAVVCRDLPQGVSSSGEIESPELVAAVLEEMLGELDVRERRCVSAIGVPAASIRVVRFPKMSWAERSRAARFEAQRFVNWDMETEPSVVRVHPIDRDENLYAVGVTRSQAADSRIAALRAARLKPVAVDHDAFALRRCLPFGDAIVDVGAERTTLHAFGQSGPLSWFVPSGGAEVTRGIARELSIDVPTAERRKRILGAAGAGTAAREALVAQIAELVDRARGRASITRVALTGNGARLPGLASDLELATGAIVEIPVAELLHTDAYPEDVIRAAAPDWTLAAGLSMWGVAV